MDFKFIHLTIKIQLKVLVNWILMVFKFINLELKLIIKLIILDLIIKIIEIHFIAMRAILEISEFNVIGVIH